MADTRGMRVIVCRLQGIAVFPVIVFFKKINFFFSPCKIFRLWGSKCYERTKKKCSQIKGGEPPGKIFGSFAG